jgi:hypothetical protein
MTGKEAFTQGCGKLRRSLIPSEKFPGQELVRTAPPSTHVERAGLL